MLFKTTFTWVASGVWLFDCGCLLLFTEWVEAHCKIDDVEECSLIYFGMVFFVFFFKCKKNPIFLKICNLVEYDNYWFGTVKEKLQSFGMCRKTEDTLHLNISCHFVTSDEGIVNILCQLLLLGLQSWSKQGCILIMAFSILNQSHRSLWCLSLY